ncbi:serine/threonine protein kinase [Babesia caballi]|uniref:non-specific serine/threonine protein kinase n=1 Tax=Babesia caballi TaxID=5871 RepID=A0AAV4LM68_BABCB|nr:serine/threonine protein kinase [Babesia caballi]
MIRIPPKVSRGTFSSGSPRIRRLSNASAAVERVHNDVHNPTDLSLERETLLTLDPDLRSRGVDVEVLVKPGHPSVFHAGHLRVESYLLLQRVLEAAGCLIGVGGKEPVQLAAPLPRCIPVFEPRMQRADAFGLGPERRHLNDQQRRQKAEQSTPRLPRAAPPYPHHHLWRLGLPDISRLRRDCAFGCLTRVRTRAYLSCLQKGAPAPVGVPVGAAPAPSRVAASALVGQPAHSRIKAHCETPIAPQLRTQAPRSNPLGSPARQSLLETMLGKDSARSKGCRGLQKAPQPDAAEDTANSINRLQLTNSTQRACAMSDTTHTIANLSSSGNDADQPTVSNISSSNLPETHGRHNFYKHPALNALIRHTDSDSLLATASVQATDGEYAVSDSSSSPSVATSDPDVIPDHDRSPSVSSPGADDEGSGTDSDDSDDSTSSKGYDCTVSESEESDAYVVGGYHPVKVGEVYEGRYRIEAKLGWGYFSTVWLAADLHSKPPSFVAIKFQRSAQNHTEAVRDEMSLLRKVRDQVISRSWLRTKRQHRQALGDHYNSTRGVVSFLNWFKVKGPHGTHICVVLEPMGPNLLSLIKLYKFKGIPLPFVRKITAHILLGLDYLHRVCGIIHTDLKPENILVTSKLNGCLPLAGDELAEALAAAARSRLCDVPYVKNTIRPSLSDPSSLTSYDDPHALQDTLFRRPYHHIPDKIAQPLRDPQVKPVDASLYHPGISELVGHRPTVAGVRKRPVHVRTKEGLMQLKPPDLSFFDSPDAVFKICDLGNSCWISQHFTDEIQTRQYRCPEAILRVGYDQSADLWSLACIVFELITGDYLFDPHGSSSEERDLNHLQLIVELLGPIPRTMIKASARFHDKEREINDVNPWPLESVLVRKYKIEPVAARKLAEFLLFMLKINPQERLPADMMMHSKWLHAGP